MLYKIIPKNDLKLFVEGLLNDYKVVGPKKVDNQHIFSSISSYNDLDLNYNMTILPPKKYFVPQRETLFTYSFGDIPEVRETIEVDPVILFGLHSCDIKGIEMLDYVFTNKYPDPYYAERRKKNIIIGIDCEPSDTCFCKSMDADQVESGFDLFLFNLGDRFLARINTSMGDYLLNIYTKIPYYKYLTSVDDPHKDIEAYKEKIKEHSEKFVIDVETAELADLMDLSYESRVWEDTAKACFGCGGCSFVCPTCYCFNVMDDVELTMAEGRRDRQWDSCLLTDFAKIAGGHNFRKDRATRLKLRYYHKQKGFVEMYGRPACVGCGRCILFCPAKINKVEVLKMIVGEVKV
jgi:ferredoxin